MKPKRDRHQPWLSLSQYVGAEACIETGAAYIDTASRGS